MTVNNFKKKESFNGSGSKKTRMDLPVPFIRSLLILLGPNSTHPRQCLPGTVRETLPILSLHQEDDSGSSIYEREGLFAPVPGYRLLLHRPRA